MDPPRPCECCIIANVGLSRRRQEYAQLGNGFALVLMEAVRKKQGLVASFDDAMAHNLS